MGGDYTLYGPPCIHTILSGFVDFVQLSRLLISQDNKF